MASSLENPFEVTKAVDFSDAQIASTWVDLPGGGFTALADPRSPMPTFVVGGKGGGRTHLLRYFSFALQRVRHQPDTLSGIQGEGYVGAYTRCSSLNSARFRGKRQSNDTWAALFSYFTDLWLGRQVLELIATIRESNPSSFPDPEIRAFGEGVKSLFDIRYDDEISTGDSLSDLIEWYRRLQRELDLAINNVGISRDLKVTIGASPGRLVFGTPLVAERELTAFRGVSFAYLLDEFENLSADQQRYINTLIREKQLPATFIVGSQIFGLRTHETLAGERNRQGSEFALVRLEGTYRAKTHRYASFCSDIARRRLSEAGVAVDGPTLDHYFAVEGRDNAESLESLAIKYSESRIHDPSQRPWMLRLAKQLREVGLDSIVAGTLSTLAVPDSPMHEKLGLLLFYRAWADRQALEAAAQTIAKGVAALRADDGDDEIRTTYKHYRADLYAQLLSDLRIEQQYLGFDQFVRMSGYLPRNMLVVLKQVTRWSLFLGEQPFRGGVVSSGAQRDGVREASAWFLEDAKGMGPIGEDTQFVIRRLGSLFRDMRFSDKPAEVSCSAFSTDRRGLSERATACLDEALSHSLILEVSTGRIDKNSQVLDHKYQLSPMLAPMFDLSLALRGVASFSASELNAVFDPHEGVGFEGVRNRILARLNAPFREHDGQATLGLG